MSIDAPRTRRRFSAAVIVPLTPVVAVFSLMRPTQPGLLPCARSTDGSEGNSGVTGQAQRIKNAVCKDAGTVEPEDCFRNNPSEQGSVTSAAVAWAGNDAGDVARCVST